MKTRNGFVSNSSSSSFLITNLTDKQLTIEDFIKENPVILENFYDNYQINKEEFSKEDLYKICQKINTTWNPNETKLCHISNENGIIASMLYDSLYSFGKSKSFLWEEKHPELFFSSENCWK